MDNQSTVMPTLLEKNIMFDSLVAQIVVKFKLCTSTHNAPSTKTSTKSNDNSHKVQLNVSTINTLNLT